MVERLHQVLMYGLEMMWLVLMLVPSLLEIPSVNLW